MKTFTVVGALLLGASTILGAQATPVGPRAGAWGAEVTFSPSASELGAAVLRFRSDRSAWLLGLDASVDRLEAGDDNPFSEDSRTSTSAAARFGLRSLRAPGSVIRPIAGAGLIGRIAQATGLQRSWEAGLYGELGMSRFFGESFSLGMTSDLQLRYGERRFSGEKETGIRVGFDAVRVSATVVF